MPKASFQDPVNSVSNMQYFVYVLQSLKDRRLYIGSTNNIERRVREHNSGKSKSTRSRKPFVLIYAEEYPTRSDAARREWHFKNTAEGNIWLKQKIATIKR